MTRLELIKEVSTNQPADIAACLCYIFKNGTYGCRACPAAHNCKDDNNGMLEYLNSDCEIGRKTEANSTMMLIHFISSPGGDRLEVKITEDSKPIFSKTYCGNRAQSRDGVSFDAHIGEALSALCDSYNIKREDIVYSGKHVYSGSTMTKLELMELDKLLFATV